MPEANAASRRLCCDAGSAEAADLTGSRPHVPQAWTAMLEGGYQSVEAASAEGGDAAGGAPGWAWVVSTALRTATAPPPMRHWPWSVPRPESLSAGRSVDGAPTLMTPTRRVSESLCDLADADANGFAGRRAELAAGRGLLHDPGARLRAEQRGADALASASNTFDNLTAVALSGDSLAPALDAANGVLTVSAPPLSLVEQARRAGLLRFVGPISVEYGRCLSATTAAPSTTSRYRKRSRSMKRHTRLFPI